MIDKGNWLIADIHQDQSVKEFVYQLQHGDLAAALRALQQLAQDYARDPVAITALAEMLRDGDQHWGLRNALSMGFTTRSPVGWRSKPGYAQPPMMRLILLLVLSRWNSI